MPALEDRVRTHVVEEMREEIRGLVEEGLSAQEIAEIVKDRRTLTKIEQDVIDLLTYHALAEARGHY